VAPPWIDNTLPGAPPQPSHPIVLPPIQPGGPPIYIWGGPGSLPGMEPRPEHPIVIPPLPPPPTEGAKPPPEDGGWGYHPDYGWGYFPPSTEAGPKK
jgi:hypothetical protein